MSAGGPRGRTTRRSLARLHADALLLHGSEEGATAGRTPDSAKVAAFDQPAGARIPWSIARPPGVDLVTAPGASPPSVESAEADISKIVEWNVESTISWLRESRLPGIEEHVFESMEEWSVDGATLVELCTGEDAMQSLESIGIDILLARKKLVAAVKKLLITQSKGNSEQSQAGQSAVGSQAQGVTSSAQQMDKRMSQMLGEKGIELPTLPTPAAGRTLCSGRQFREFKNATVMWAAMGDAMYAKCFEDVYSNPGIEVDQSVRNLPDLTREMDCKLGLHLYQKCPSVSRKLLSDDDYLIDGRGSGLKIFGFFGGRINQVSRSQGMTAIRNLTQRKPLDKITSLGKEIQDIERLLEEMQFQQQEMPPQMLYAVVENVMTDIVKDPKYTELVMLPIREHAMNGEQDGIELLEVLREIDYELNNNPRHNHLKEQKPAVAAATTRAKPPAGHTATCREGEPCINLRDLGKCEFKKCKADHTQTKYVFTNKECST